MTNATKAKKHYMSDDEFAELKESLKEVISYLKGKPTDIKITRRAVKAKPGKMGRHEGPSGTGSRQNR